MFSIHSGQEGKDTSPGTQVVQPLNLQPYPQFSQSIQFTYRDYKQSDAVAEVRKKRW